MLWTEEERKICKEHERDKYGRVGCKDCPLRIKGYDRMCKANAHYNKAIGRWEFDWR